MIRKYCRLALSAVHLSSLLCLICAAICRHCLCTPPQQCNGFWSRWCAPSVHAAHALCLSLSLPRRRYLCWPVNYQRLYWSPGPHILRVMASVSLLNFFNLLQRVCHRGLRVRPRPLPAALPLKFPLIPPFAHPRPSRVPKLTLHRC